MDGIADGTHLIVIVYMILHKQLVWLHSHTLAFPSPRSNVENDILLLSMTDERRKCTPRTLQENEGVP